MRLRMQKVRRRGFKAGEEQHTASKVWAEAFRRVPFVEDERDI
jgi:hypothetical protein